MRCTRLALLIALAACLPMLAAADTMRVGIAEAAPFVILEQDERPTGISIELWEMIAEQLGVETDYVHTDLAGLLDGVEGGELDVAVAALTMTAGREERLDFTHPFYSSGLGIATRMESGVLVQALRTVIHPVFLGTLATLSLLLLGVGMVVWLLERKRNAEQFGGRTIDGLGKAMWWSAVTMTTVGYGDMAPKTPLGRFITIWWMFASVILISSFSGTIASTLTAERVSGAVSSPKDLGNVTVGVLGDSTGAAYAAQRGLRSSTYQDLDSALTDLEEGRIGAVVYDKPMLRWLTRDRKDLQVLAQVLQNEDYAFAMPTGAVDIERVNRALLAAIEEGRLARIRQDYLGSE